MKRANRVLVGLCCVALLLMSWFAAVSTKSNAQKQIELIKQAAAFMQDELYVRAEPLLYEAAGYNAAHTAQAETELKKVYLALLDTQGYSRKYTELLEKQMSRKDAAPEIFEEAANYYLGVSKLNSALTILKNGVEKTGSDDLRSLYENNRYAFDTGRTVYENVTVLYGSTIQVQLDGKWGIAGASGSLMIPCEYEKISTYNTDRCIVKKDGEIYAVNRDNNRVSLLHEKASDFGNFGNNLIPILTEEGWRRATGDFVVGSTVFEELGMYSNGHAAAKMNGMWGVIDLDAQWVIPPEYDEIICDELGRSYAQGAVFARKGSEVFLLIDGSRTGEIFEDARPFPGEGLAAVKKNGKWGFIDSGGAEWIGFTYDDALSFGQHLAAVKQGDFWGYISLYNRIVIEPQFEQAKSFSEGCAPVLTDSGWQFISLIEFKKGANL